MHRTTAAFALLWAIGVGTAGLTAYELQIRSLFETSCRKLGLATRDLELSTEQFVREPEQMDLFG